MDLLRRKRVLINNEYEPNPGNLLAIMMDKVHQKKARHFNSEHQMPDPVQAKKRNWKLYMMGFLNILIVWIIIIANHFPQQKNQQPQSLQEVQECPLHVSTETLTFVEETRYLMVSAYKDHREREYIRILSIINRDHEIPLYCLFCCTQRKVTAIRSIVKFHTVHYGFPYGAADVLCPDVPLCNATHVTVTPDLTNVNPNVLYLPIQNKNIRDQIFTLNITVCFSNVLGGMNNNVLQFVQIMEIYKYLGVQKMVVYKANCGPDLEKVLRYYQTENYLEILSWPINKYIDSDLGWTFRGEVHNYGQLTIMNDCIYRNMDQSHYVLLADVEQIIFPYQHASLTLLLKELQEQYSNVATFLFETHVLPTSVSDDEGRFDLPEWRLVPGVNIFRNVYRIPVDTDDFKATKMIVNPRAIEQTSIFEVLHQSGDTLKVPPNMSKVLQFSNVGLGNLVKENLTLDHRIWDLGKQLVPNINEVLRKSGVVLLKNGT